MSLALPTPLNKPERKTPNATSPTDLNIAYVLSVCNLFGGSDDYESVMAPRRLSR